MAVASIYAKLDDLEKKLQNLVDTTILENRISELEEQITQLKAQDLQKKVNDISSVIPSIAQINDRLAKVETKAVDTGIFLDKLNNLETNVIKSLVLRIEALEQKYASLPA